MSAISGFGGFGGAGLSSIGGHSGRGSRVHGPDKGLQQDLTDFLTSKGVSGDEQAQIQSDITAALKDIKTEGGRPDPSKLRDVVDGVLSKHNVDANEFATKFHAPPPPPPSADSENGIDALTQTSTSETEDSSKTEDFVKQLLEILSKAAEQFHHRLKSSSEATASPDSTNAAAPSATSTAETPDTASVNNRKHCLPYASNSAESLEVGITLNFTA